MTDTRIRHADNARRAARHHSTAYTGRQLLIAAIDQYEAQPGPTGDGHVEQAIDLMISIAELTARPDSHPALPGETWILTGLEGMIRRYQTTQPTR